MKKISLLLLATLVMATNAYATLINFTCPLPENISFKQLGMNEFFADGPVNIIKPKDYPVFFLQGVTRDNQISHMFQANYSRDHLTCYYWGGEDRMIPLELKAEFIPELEYCYFNNGDKNQCEGDPVNCQLTCEVL